MRIIYFSSSPFADCDFPLVRQFQQMGHEVYYFIDLPCYFLRSTLIDIKKQIPQNGIFCANKYNEFNIYKDYLSLDKVYVINRINKSAINRHNIILFVKLLSIIRKLNPDVINIVGDLDILSSIFLFLRKKIVLTVHDPFPHSGEQYFRREFFRKLAMKNIPKFILLNDKQRRDFINTYHLNDNQVFINHLGIYDCIHQFIKNDKQESDNDSNYILFFGRISPYKGIEYLLEAMKIVHEKIPNAILTVAGGGKIYFDVSKYKGLSYIEIRNYYIGMEELADLINRAKIVVCPYTDATQSGVIMTAYSLCKPVIATNVGGLCEMVEDGKTGLLIPARDTMSLASSIIKLLAEKNNLFEMRKYISERYFLGDRSWKSIAEKYIDIYQH